MLLRLVVVVHLEVRGVERRGELAQNVGCQTLRFVDARSLSTKAQTLYIFRVELVSKSTCCLLTRCSSHT
jgi:hypothetical protein